MLRLKPFLVGAAIIASAIVLLGVLHQRTAGVHESARENLAVGFLPVT
jgi:hypothetical protein